MSARLLGIGFACDMGTPWRKLILLKLIDACEEDGTRIFPAVATIARAAQCSPRQVQRELRLFERANLIRLVREGGRGRGNTNEYALDVALLKRIEAEGWSAIAPDDDDGGKGDCQSPLEKGDSGDAKRATGATVKGDQSSHPTPPDPSIDPSEDERESARARDPSDDQGSEPSEPEDDGKSSDGRTIKVFLLNWPTAGVDNRQRTERAWMALTPAERTAALELIGPWLAEARRHGRTKPPAGSTWLSDKPWETWRPDAQRSPGRFEAPAWSREWWALLFAAIEAGDLRKASAKITTAKAGAPWTVPASDQPSTDTVGRFRQVGAQSREWQAWDAWCRARGVYLPRWDHSVWCWVPAHWPPGHERAGSSGQDDGACLAREVGL